MTTDRFPKTDQGQMPKSKARGRGLAKVALHRKQHPHANLGKYLHPATGVADPDQDGDVDAPGAADAD